MNNVAVNNGSITKSLNKGNSINAGANQPGNRLVAIDILRGLIIVLMALDHTRDFWGAAGFSPTDLSQTSPSWFFTRWVTHLCAPLFVFLTGMSAFLYGQKVRSKRELRNFLLSRGIWLILLEITLVNISWQFGMNLMFIQVIWAIGFSMLVLAILIYLPNHWILILTVPFILLHNLFNDAEMARLFGESNWLWSVLHQRNAFRLFDTQFYLVVTYPLLPWFSVMALGYVVGHLFNKKPIERQRALLLMGVSFSLVFILLRASGGYGDPSIWQNNSDSILSWLSFLNTTKYPASLQFLLMTLGPGLVLLALLDRIERSGRTYRLFRWLKVFGAVPLFFYLLHVPIINISAHIYTYFRYGEAVNFFYGQSVWPEGYTPNLLLVYVAWCILVGLLYYPCKRFGEIKRESESRLLSYL
ncbi:DUF1624 domain-containing protein [Aliikangiella coralliicola]|uniref:DUF1624 domain-containing protein n=1 Tax=Aliikangiella coralliicola TaxID=2592383 RepID=A0A545UDU5_9GAMM|nr:heparan-alpha-glucosaminide N-acetyltransferase domain-containing protein [Aliikangiella coralliicola]TQV87628.1 DUF1624 domain-containing protein [Aliikangiella coralliicola]